LPTAAFLICLCGAAQIPAPVGSTESMCYACRRCCAKIQRQRNIQSVMAFRQGRGKLTLCASAKSGDNAYDFSAINPTPTHASEYSREIIRNAPYVMRVPHVLDGREPRPLPKAIEDDVFLR
jgi:hypothetical protein